MFKPTDTTTKQPTPKPTTLNVFIYNTITSISNPLCTYRQNLIVYPKHKVNKIEGYHSHLLIQEKVTHKNLMIKRNEKGSSKYINVQ